VLLIIILEVKLWKKILIRLKIYFFGQEYSLMILNMENIEKTEDCGLLKANMNMMLQVILNILQEFGGKRIVLPGIG